MVLSPPKSKAVELFDQINESVSGLNLMHQTPEGVRLLLSKISELAEEGKETLLNEQP